MTIYKEKLQCTRTTAYVKKPSVGFVKAQFFPDLTVGWALVLQEAVMEGTAHRVRSRAHLDTKNDPIVLELRLMHSLFIPSVKQS